MVKNDLFSVVINFSLSTSKRLIFYCLKKANYGIFLTDIKKQNLKFEVE